MKAERKLEALEGCGVDNWEGYDDAMKIFWDEGDEEGEDEEEEIYSQGPPHIAFCRGEDDQYSEGSAHENFW